MSKEIEQKSKCCEKCVVKIQYGDWGCENSDCSCHLEQNWEEEFEKMLKDYDHEWCVAHGESLYCHLDDELDNKDNIIPMLKSFIRHQKQLSFNEALELVEKEINDFYIMKGGKIDRLPEPEHRTTNLLNENMEIGFSQACRDILSIITNLKQK